MRLGTRVTALLLSVPLLMAAVGSRHACVLLSSDTHASHDEHQHHSSRELPDNQPPLETDCQMYVSCGMSVAVAAVVLDDDMPFAYDVASHEPELSYFSPSLPHETPPPRA